MWQRIGGKNVKTFPAREYNIVTNRYLEQHEMKKETNVKVQKADCA